jgi:hypothetical protein
VSDDCEPQLRRKRRLNGDALSRLPFRAVSSSDDDDVDDDPVAQLSPALETTPATTTTTPWETWIHLVKGYIGPGCLSLPWAYSRFDNVGYSLNLLLVASERLDEGNLFPPEHCSLLFYNSAGSFPCFLFVCT